MRIKALTKKFTKGIALSLALAMSVTILPASPIFAMTEEEKFDESFYLGTFYGKIPNAFTDAAVKKTDITLDKGFSVKFLPKEEITYPSGNKDAKPTITYPAGYICKAFSFTTDDTNAFYKIHVGNISTSDDMLCNIYDTYGENIGKDNGGEIKVSMSQAKDPVIKLKPNKSYYIVLAAPNSKKLLDESTGRISISKISDDIADEPENATAISFDKLNKYKLQGYKDNDYFTFKTKETDAFYNLYTYNENISNDVVFEVLTEQNEFVASYTLKKEKTNSKTLRLSNNSNYYIRVYSSSASNVYSTDMVGDYSFKVEVIDDDWPDINISAPAIKMNETYQGQIQHSDDKDIMKFNSANINKFTLQVTNFSTTEKIEYKIQTYNKENIVSDKIAAGFIGDIQLGGTKNTSVFQKNTDYYIIFSGKEGTNYSFSIAPRKHYINYELNGGINDPQNPTFFNESAETTLYAPTKENYVFDGWYTTENFIIENSKNNKNEEPEPSLLKDLGAYTENITLYAKWSPESYRVSYLLMEGINSEKNPTKVTVEDTVLLESPTKAGYTFAGWYTSPLYEEDTRVVEISKPTKDIRLYAKWTKVSSAVPSIKKISSKTQKVTVSWKKVSGAKGYEVKYSTKSSMAGAKTLKLAASKTSATITKLAKGKKCYVQVRSYKKDSTGAKVYSKWSSKKNVKIK